MTPDNGAKRTFLSRVTPLKESQFLEISVVLLLENTNHRGIHMSVNQIFGTCLLLTDMTDTILSVSVHLYYYHLYPIPIQVSHEERGVGTVVVHSVDSVY
jgi:phosphoserine aminotransferase